VEEAGMSGGSFLVLGSAPGVVEWWEQRARQFDGWAVCPINNAWRVIGPEQIHTWFRSTDFSAIGAVQPGEDDMAALAPKIVEYFCETPCSYDKQGGSGTMLAGALCHLLNAEHPARVRVVGSDFQYNGGTTTHFYGAGTPDPLRYGEAWLVGVMQQIREHYDAAGVSLGRYRDVATLLPFDLYEEGK
jgi:hypothetical protein